jgi:hypothetical protein
MGVAGDIPKTLLVSFPSIDAFLTCIPSVDYRSHAIRPRLFLQKGVRLEEQKCREANGFTWNSATEAKSKPE